MELNSIENTLFYVAYRGSNNKSFHFKVDLGIMV